MSRSADKRPLLPSKNRRISPEKTGKTPEINQKQRFFMPLPFTIGFQPRRGKEMTGFILRHTARIREVYFAWGDFSSGRGRLKTEAEQQATEEALAEFSRAGLGLDLLLKQGDMVLYGPNQWHMQYADTDVSPRCLRIFFEMNGDLSALLNRKFGATDTIRHIHIHVDVRKYRIYRISCIKRSFRAGGTPLWSVV